jgi:MFS family permease
MKWNHLSIGSFMACWVIGYGVVQTLAPHAIKKKQGGITHTAQAALIWGIILTTLSGLLATGVHLGFHFEHLVVGGLILFGVVFAMNSALHSYLILAYSDSDKAALNVGFYYMANAGGRLFGTLLSGLIYQWAGLAACLWTSTLCLSIAVLCTIALPRGNKEQMT